MIKLSAADKKKNKIEKEKKQKQPHVLNYEHIILRFQKLKPKYLNLPLLLAVVGLSAFGVLMIFSASSYNASVYFNNPYYYFTKQVVGFLIGLIALAAMYLIDYRVLARFRWLILGAAVAALLLVFVPGIGISRLGAQRWIGIGGFSMQPSELAKFAFIVFAAATFAKPRKNEKTLLTNKTETDVPTFKTLAVVLAAGVVLCGLILLQPNLSITLVVGATVFCMLFLCGVRLKHLGLLILPVLVLLPVLLIAEPYRIRRLVAFVDPWSTPRAEGFQLIQSLFSLGNGGIWGVGFGNSTQKHMFLPFSESDFIFSIIGEEFGLAGCIVFLAVLGYIVLSIFRIGVKCKERFGKYICFGVGTIIFVQSIINIAVVTGAIPPTGLPLPFISYGGTSLAVFMGAVGMVLNVGKSQIKSAGN